jgi:transposase
VAAGPALRPGQVVVMDNFGAHRPKRVRELVEARGCELLYLPPYSPDLNPIAEAFSKVKRIFRKLGARTKEALIEATGRALEAVSARDVRGLFVPCGYRPSAAAMKGAVRTIGLLSLKSTNYRYEQGPDQLNGHLGSRR